MALNFNVSPYYDDFDPTKNFHRILFKPGVAVQARELTQAQTILQNQISNFADHIFTQNTPVSGAKVTTNLDCYYIKLNLQYNSVNIVASDFLNKVITDSTGTILAKVIATSESTGTETEIGDPPTLVVSYISGLHFSDGMEITPVDGTNIFATTIGSPGGTSSVGPSSVASITTGIFYIVNGYSQSPTPNEDGTYTKYSIGNFVQVNPQTIILEKYDNSPTYRVGLEISETIIDYVDDPSLLDLAVGASNYQAPGADRYKIDLTLTKLPLTLGNDSQFIELVRTVDGIIVKQVDNTVYSAIDDYFAKRDFESNGDYIVNDFKLTPSTNSDSNKYDLTIGPGVAYVHGYRIDNTGPIVLTNDRARNTTSVGVNNVYVDYGNYYYVDTITGSFNPTEMPTVHLHCVPSDKISANVNGVTSNTNTYSSTLVGTAKIRNLDYVTDSGSSNTASYVYQAYLTDINTNVLSGVAKSSGSSTLTLAINDPIGRFSTQANAYSGMTISITSGTSFGDKRIIESYNGATKTLTVTQPFTLVPDTSTKFSLLMQNKDVDSIVIPAGTSSFSANANINILSRVGNIGSAAAELKSPGGQELIFPVGNPYVANVTNSNYTTTRVFRNQSFSSSTGLTISLGTEPFTFTGSGTLSSDTIKENYTIIDVATGKILDFATTPGNTVVVTSGTQVSFSSTFHPSTTVDIIAKVNVTNADADSDSGLVLKWKNLVTGNTSGVGTLTTVTGSNTKIDLTNGQVLVTNAMSKSQMISLFTSDVKRIVKVIDTGSPAVDPTTAMLNNSKYDVTNRYILNNGQKDSYYDHAFIMPLPGANLAKGKLLIIFDYYDHSGGDGLFSVLSYLGASNGGSSTSPEQYTSIPSYTASSGITYKLSDCLDFRPSRKNGESQFVFNYHNTSPSTRGIFIPVNLTNFESSYSYYLGRKDLLILSKDKSFEIIQGTPSTNPIYPSQPDGAMVVANLSHDPYTAYIPGENPSNLMANLSIGKILHKRWTKSDITDLQTRVNDLEYYTSLSLLEQKAQSLQVPDENGLNRFKNGILVDDFTSYSVCDTDNDDFSSNINIRLGRLTPLTPVLNYQLQNPQVLSSLSTLANNTTFNISSINGGSTNIFTLPYSSANVVVQQLASSTVSVNPFNVVIQQGVAALTPPMDNWVDTAQAPSILVTSPGLNINQQTGGINITNAGDFALIPGTSITPEFGASQTTSSGVASSTLTTNGYVQNVSILPYIRPQQLGFRTKGLLVNTPISCWFDGVNVNQYITTPDTLELTGVTGTFKEDDIIGYFTNNTFYPVARVLGVYKYPNSTKARLYVSVVPDVPIYTSSSIIQNAKFDSNGFYISNSSTARGTLTSGGQSISLSGTVRGVGDFYIPGNATPVKIYKMNFNNGPWSSFLNQYGVWGDTTRTSTFSYSPKFIPDVAGNYTFTCSSTGTSVSVVANTGSSIFSSVTMGTAKTATVNITPTQVGGNFTIAINVSGSTPANGFELCGFALTVTDPNGNMVFNTLNPPEVLYTNVEGGYEDLPKGGRYFTGVKQIQLGENASANTNYYTGCTINITSKYIYTLIQETATYHPRRWVAATVPDGDNAYWAPAYTTYDIR